MPTQRRNRENYNENFIDSKGRKKKGTVKKGSKNWNDSKAYKTVRSESANLERKLVQEGVTSVGRRQKGRKFVQQAF